MDRQPGWDDGTGDDPDSDPDAPGGRGGPGGTPRYGRDPRLAAFARHEEAGAPVPCGPLALLADQLSGPERRCPGATGNELTGLLQTWAAIESWAAAGKLGVIRSMMRRDRAPSPGSDHGDLPETWSRSLRYELSAALACSTQSAESTAWLAWELQARLPGIGARLEDGTLTPAKAKAVAETFMALMDADAAAAEALIVDQLAGRTYPQVLRLAEQAALTVDPGLAERRREEAQKNARVSFFREQTGTAGLSGRDLPPDAALAAMAAVNDRAQEYKESLAFDGVAMDMLRAYAYLDLINGLPTAERIAIAEAEAGPADTDPPHVPGQTRTGGSTPSGPGNPADCACGECDGTCHDHDDDHDPGEDSGPDDSGPGHGPGDGPGPRPAGPTAGRMRQPAPSRPDCPAGHPPRPRRAARRDPWLRLPRPRPRPRTDRRCGRHPAHPDMRDRHQPRGIRHRPRMRPP